MRIATLVSSLLFAFIGQVFANDQDESQSLCAALYKAKATFFVSKKQDLIEAIDAATAENPEAVGAFVRLKDGKPLVLIEQTTMVQSALRGFKVEGDTSGKFGWEWRNVAYRREIAEKDAAQDRRYYESRRATIRRISWSVLTANALYNMIFTHTVAPSNIASAAGYVVFAFGALASELLYMPRLSALDKRLRKVERDENKIVEQMGAEILSLAEAGNDKELVVVFIPWRSMPLIKQRIAETGKWSEIK